MIEITPWGSENREFVSSLFVKRSNLKNKTLTWFSENRYTEIASLQAKTICFVVAFEIEHYSVHTSLPLFSPLYIKKNAPNQVTAKIEQRTLEPRQEDFPLRDIQQRSKATTCQIWWGLGDFPHIAPIAVPCRSSPHSIHPFIGHICKAARLLPATRFNFIKEMKKRSIKRKYYGRKEDESDCGRDSEATQREGHTTNYLWSNHTITISEKNNPESTRPLQTCAWDRS